MYNEANSDEPNNDKANNGDDGQGWILGKKRPHKGIKRRGIIHPDKYTGIRKPANQVKNITWDHLNPIEEEDEEEEVGDMDTSVIHGDVGTGIQYVQMVSKSRKTPWRKVYVGDPNQSRPYRGEFKRQPRQPSYSRQSRKRSHSIRPSHPRPLGHDGGRRTHKHKRKNKHTRRRRVQSRRA